MKIEGFFSKIKTANETVDKIKGLGVKKVFVDINDVSDRDAHINIAGTQTGVSLSSLILKSGTDEISTDKAPLNASNPMVSGYGRFEEVADINCKVIVETGESNADKVKQIIKDMGGDLENPLYIKEKPKNEEI